jgi:hypothetical protein
MVWFLVGAFVVNVLVFGGVSAVYFADKHRGDNVKTPAKALAQALARLQSKVKAPVPPSRRLPAARDRDRFRAAYAGP